MIYYIYGVDGIAGFNFEDKVYLYRKNVQGDITHIYRKDGNKDLVEVAHYAYDAWGNTQILSETDKIGSLNPFRYRGYYFDIETKLYYLISRYYDPETCRFISADGIEYLDPETLGGLNLYAYCCNNPVMGYDPEGTWNWGKFWKVLKVIASVAIVVGAVAVSIMTAGTAVGLIAAGAAIGGALSGAIGGINGIVEAKKTGANVFDAFADGLFAGTITGAISGAIAASPIGIGGQILINTTLSVGQYCIQTHLSGEEFKFSDLFISLTIGIISGCLGGAGAMALGKGIRAKFLLNQIVKVGVSNFNTLLKPISKSSVGTLLGNVLNSLFHNK